MRAVLAALLLVSVAAACGAAQTETRAAQEIERLDAALKMAEAAAADLPKDVHPLFEAHRGALDRAKKATLPEYKLYRLRDAFVGIETLSFLAKEHKAAAESVATFEKLWREHRARFEAKPPGARGTLLQRALVE